jgi:hypothetical protein
VVNKESKWKRVGEILVETKHITQAKLDEALAIQKKPGEKRMIGQILLGRGLVTRAQLEIALAKQKALTK